MFTYMKVIFDILTILLIVWPVLSYFDWLKNYSDDKVAKWNLFPLLERLSNNEGR